MKVNHVIVANFYIADMSFNTIRDNKIAAKISEFTVYHYCIPSDFIRGIINMIISYMVLFYTM